MPGGSINSMLEQERPLELIIICAVMLVLSILGVVSAMVTRLIFNVDGLLMVSVCLLGVVIFGILLYVLAKEQGWIGKSRTSKDSTTAANTSK